MKWLKKIVQNEDGSALATVLVIAVIVSLFIGAILSGIILHSKFIQRDINSSKALYAAEEGAYRFLHTNKKSSSYASSKQILLDNGNEAEINTTLFGWGDIKLIGVLGLYLGWEGFLVVYIAIILGGLLSIFGIVSKKISKYSKIPFAIFLFFGKLILLLNSESYFSL